ncbi:helix-turn-helix domain-containing protein [Polynucleobacter paneuropaeus]|nr:helix-turn-helix domain-containing protein [Polynucleobacter paneuropaeus]MBT8611576.1 helix-turn-helix domain-containing protein [Polynucleobacter paneuropaeus]
METAAITPKQSEFLIQEGWGARLRQERKRLAFTQAEIAKLSGVSVVTYQQYEREEFEPRLGYLNQLANLEVSIRFVMFGESDKPRANSLHPRELELMAFQLVQDHLNKEPVGDVGADGRFALFDLFRAELEKISENEFDLSLNSNALIKNLVLSKVNSAPSSNH